MKTSKQKLFKSPIFVLGTPRSGTTLTYMLLASSYGVWSSFDEDHLIFEDALGLRIDPVHDKEGKGVLLLEEDVTPERKEIIYDYFWKVMANPAMFGISGFQWGVTRKIANQFSRIIRCSLRFPVTMVHKNARNTFRISFLRAVFPDARFVFIFRDGRANVSSLIEGWGFDRFHTFKVPVSDGDGGIALRQWAFELPPKWEAWAEKSIPEIAAFQWVAHNDYLLSCREKLPSNAYIALRYEDLVDNTPREVDRICRFLNIPVGRALRRAAQHPRPVVETTLPQKNKWLKRKDEIEKVRHIMQPMMDRLGYNWNRID